MHIDDALARFTLQLEADGRSVHTVNQYRRHVRALAAWLGPECDIAALSHEDIARFFVSPAAKQRADGGLKRATSMNALRGSISCFFRYLHEAGHVPVNPTRLIRRARCGPPPPRYLTDNEQGRLLAELEADDSFEARRDLALVRLMLATGIRLGSAIALDADDLDGDMLWLRTIKGDRPDRKVLSASVAAELRDWIGNRDGPVFCDRTGTRNSHRQAQRRFAGWCEAAGIRRASLHGLRHSFAVRMYRETRDLLAVQRALGHRSISATVGYARVAD